jgi:hypothetical protein
MGSDYRLLVVGFLLGLLFYPGDRGDTFTETSVCSACLVIAGPLLGLFLYPKDGGDTYTETSLSYVLN